MLANIEMDAYMMESMGYVTAGILDSVVHPDAAVESAIVKVHELSMRHFQESALFRLIMLVVVNAEVLPVFNFTTLSEK